MTVPLLECHWGTLFSLRYVRIADERAGLFLVRWSVLA